MCSPSQEHVHQRTCRLLARRTAAACITLCILSRQQWHAVQDWKVLEGWTSIAACLMHSHLREIALLEDKPERRVQHRSSAASLVMHAKAGTMALNCAAASVCARCFCHSRQCRSADSTLCLWSLTPSQQLLLFQHQGHTPPSHWGILVGRQLHVGTLCAHISLALFNVSTHTVWHHVPFSCRIIMHRAAGVKCTFWTCVVQPPCSTWLGKVVHPLLKVPAGWAAFQWCQA